MFMIVLKLTETKSQASQFMEAHNDWIKRGFDSGIFLLSGGIKPHLGGVVFAHNIALSDLQDLINDDPFVANNVVKAEIIQIAPERCDKRLAFLMDK